MSNKSRIYSDAEAAGFFLCVVSLVVNSQRFPRSFFTSPAAVAISVAVAVVLVVKSGIGGFWGLPFGDDWEFDWGYGGGTPGVSTRATNAPSLTLTQDFLQWRPIALLIPTRRSR